MRTRKRMKNVGEAQRCNFTEARLGWKGSPCCARSSYQARHACLLCKNRENVSDFLQVQKKRTKNVGEAQRCNFTEARLGWKDSPCCARSFYQARHACLLCKNRENVSYFLQVQKQRMKNVGEAQRCKFTEARLGWKGSPCCAGSSYLARHARLPCKNRDSCDSET